MNRIAISYALAWLFATIGPCPVSADDFPAPPDTEPSATRALSPAEAAAGFRSPEGFRVGVFAAEPEVRNPVAMAWDRRGRLWVAENYTYAELPRIFDLRLRDREKWLLGKINAAVPQSEVNQVNKIKAEIIAGKIKNIPTTVK